VLCFFGNLHQKLWYEDNRWKLMRKSKHSRSFKNICLCDSRKNKRIKK